jgi:uncharacterized protein with HEPN domain
MKDNNVYLQHILEKISNILEDTEYHGHETFLLDRKTQDAVIRNVEVIGEAVKMLGSEITEKYSEIPWKAIARARDLLIHHYFEVNLDEIWRIVKEDLIKLRSVIERIIKDSE